VELSYRIVQLKCMHFQCKKVECRSGSLHVGSVAMAIKNVRQH
jgi:hypothetical protein